MMVQAAQDRLLGHVEVGFLKMGFAARLHLAQFGLQIAVGLGKGGRLLIKRHGLIPPLEAGLIEAVEIADVINPSKDPRRKRRGFRRKVSVMLGESVPQTP